MSDPRTEQHNYLEKVLTHTRLSPTALAKKAKLAQTTITRFLNAEDHAFLLSARTVAAIEKATGIRYSGAGLPAVPREIEAIPFDKRAPQRSGEMVSHFVGDQPALVPWMLRSRALEAIGYLPNDILIVDPNATAEPGDIVWAQVYEWNKTNPETVFRKWEPPYLVAASANPEALVPLVVDNRNVIIKGIVVASLRPRQARKAA